MMKNEEIKEKMICGDWIVVANMLNISPKNARMGFSRPNSKHYFDIVKTIEKIIKNREELFAHKNK